MRRVYLAGPMGGVADWNFPAFDEAEKRWMDAGYVVTTPASVARATGVKLGDVVDDATIRLTIQVDLVYLFNSDAIALLEGWEKSKGVAIELAVAQFLDIPIKCAKTMQDLVLMHTPWRALDAAYKELAECERKLSKV